MDFRILGPLEVEAEAGPVVLPRGRGRSLLGLLILRAGEVVSTARLIDELWGEAPPPTALTALHGLVAALRRRLEPARPRGQPPAVLLTRSPGYILAIDRGQVDANRFRDLVEAAAGVPARERAASLRQALALWRGPALADFAYEPFAQTEITALSELRLTAVEERIEADLAVGRHAGVVAELETLVVEHPLRERLRAQLMLALYRFGRQADALAVYADARGTLGTELGIDPGPELRDLERAILRQDPSLDLQVTASAADSVAGPAGAVAAAGMEAWLTHSRKTVTVVFVDLSPAAGRAVGSDPEALREVVGRGVDCAVEVLGRHGGTVEGVIADVVVAVFGVPVAHEDDAARAVRAAAEVCAALAARNADVNRDIRVAARIGVNTGEVVVGDPGVSAVASGGAAHVAARLQQAASDGEVLLGEATRRLVEDIVVVEPADAPGLREGGRAGGAWRLVEARADRPARTPPLDTPLVGREAELAWLQASFVRTAEQRRPELAAVVGDAGVGKSRLALEFTGTLKGQARILTGHCPAYGQGITYWPLREIVADAADSSAAGDVLDRLEGDEVLGADLFPAVRRFVEALAAEQPLIVVLEDGHWAQPTFLDLLGYLAESVHGPVLLLCLARPELLERRPGWGQEEHSVLLGLDPLGREDSSTLVAERLAGRGLPPETITQVIEAAQGNPLFVEQLTAALRDERELRIPPSLQALLAARLDRLGPGERDLLRCASVVGVTFSPRALTALVPDQAHPFLGRHLRSLEDKELVRRSRRHFLAEPAWGFRHVLIQQAAYRSMTLKTRAELHERFAGLLVTEAPGSSVDTDELIGYHLEQAYRHRRDLDAADRRTSDLAVRAGERLAVAGLRANRRLDIAGAENLLARARELLPADHPRRRAVMVHLAEGYPMLGRHADADGVLAELLEEVRAGEDRRLEQLLRLERARVRLLLGPDPVGLDAIRREAEQTRATLEADDDHAGVAKALFVLGLVRRREGAISAFEALARQGLAAALRAGHAREEAGARWNVAWAVQAGPTPVQEAIRVCADLAPLKDTLHPGVLCELASLHAMLGEHDEACDLIARTRRLMLERWRQRGPLMYPAAAAGRAAILAGDPVAADRELRAALDLAVEMGIREHTSQLAATLAVVLARLGRLHEAERFAAVSAARAPAESVASQAAWRAATGLIRSMRGEHRDAERFARAAVAWAPRDMLNLRAELHADLADLLRAAGQHRAAVPVISEATALYERKGNLAGAARTRALHAEIAGAIDPLPHV